MKTQQKGFTLIELIIVIVVLGILAVTAAPQFFNFSSDARVATLKGIEGSIKGANQMVYGRASIQGATLGASTVKVRGNTTVNTYNGYVQAADLKEILDAADFTFIVKTAGNYTETAPGTPTTPGVYYVISSDITLASNDADGVEAAACYLKYTDSASANAEPTIDIEDDGC
ncbi:MSHA pilin protein MshA [Pseudidiomarina indica]|uniref:MSHA pilin protein MshA n=1 Tax=Pseudidiomarina indica TaxID=1159017 RepID=A0A1G6CJS3_9GAMM|nr:type II secretion system protein [Pseudidiomarina indica]SDB33091.1 MSHA pilin protein MshA [Pseudidiomarina indica]